MGCRFLTILYMPHFSFINYHQNQHLSSSTLLVFPFILLLAFSMSLFSLLGLIIAGGATIIAKSQDT